MALRLAIILGLASLSSVFASLEPFTGDLFPQTVLADLGLNRTLRPVTPPAGPSAGLNLLSRRQLVCSSGFQFCDALTDPTTCCEVIPSLGHSACCGPTQANPGGFCSQYFPATCCNNGTCESTESCCGDGCMSETESCCGDFACTTSCCGSTCTPVGGACCGDHVCDTVGSCCGSGCTPPGWTCCGANGPACSPGNVCIASGNTFRCGASTTPTPTPTPTPRPTPTPSPTTAPPPNVDIESNPSFTIVRFTTTETATQILTGSETETLATATTDSGPTNRPSSIWGGSGPLLQAYCATPSFSKIAGPTESVVYYAGIVGCMGDKPDCCPGQYGAGPGLEVASNAFPVPANLSAETLSACPEDYELRDKSCCPIGYDLWNEKWGGQTPCYSSLREHLTPPPATEGNEVPDPGGAASITTTTIVNLVYARSYPVQSSGAGLSTGATAGIGAGVGLAGLIILGGVVYFVIRWRKRRNERRLERESHDGGYSPNVAQFHG